MKEIKTGSKCSKKYKVLENDLAVNVKSGSLRVLATPVLAAWIEETSLDVLKDALEGEETTVGTYLELFHNAPTPLNSEVEVEAELKEVNGREFVFEVTASDETGEITKCTHKRFLVYSNKFQSKADSRKK